jgi:hypothetical protein
MSERVEEIRHDDWCCEERNEPHIHVGEQDGRAMWRLGHVEFRAGSMDAVLEAADAWLHRFSGDDDE